MMSTTAKGNKFEETSLHIIEKMLAEEQFGFNSRFLKIQSKVPYYSQLRKKHIIFDLSIEIWPPGATRYSQIYLIECKHYGRRVSVDKINDFIFRVQEVAPVNGKAIFITNSPLQEAAYNVAEATRMMVVQGESSEDYKIIMHKMTRNVADKTIAILPETFQPELMDEGVQMIAREVDQQLLKIFLENTGNDKVSYGIDKLSKIDIEKIAHKELDKMNPRILSTGYHISPKSFRDFLKGKYGITIFDDIETPNIMGAFDLETSTLSVNSAIVGTARELFILAHEFGHFVLHQKLQIGQYAYNNFNDAEMDFRKGRYDLTNPRNWIEWQANHFASCIVLPAIPFRYRLGIVQDSLKISTGQVYLDDQPKNQSDFMDLVSKLAYRFSVTKTSVIYKLKDLELLIDRTRAKTIGQLISEYENDLYS